MYRDHLERAAERVGLLLQAVSCVGTDLVQLGVAVVGVGQQHDAGRDEAREVVDVAVGLVPGQPAAEPDHLAGTQVLAQQPLDLGAVEARVAVGVEQALFGRQHGPLAVDVHRPALQHQRRAVALGAFDLEHPRGGLFVALPAGIEAAPGVEAPVNAAATPGAVEQEARADVPHPGVVGRDLDQPRRGRQELTGLRQLLGRGGDGHGLGRRDRAGHLGERPLCGPRPFSPVVVALRPRHPAAGVRLPLGGHVKAIGGRCRIEGRRHGQIITEAPRVTPCPNRSA